MRFVRLLWAFVPAVLMSGFAAEAQAQAACFYEHINFQGRRTCIEVGQRIALVTMNDKFSSVQVQPGVRVTMCEHANFAGRCAPVDRTIASFVEIGWNDRVSSIAADFGGAPGGPGYGGPPQPGPGPGYGGPPPPLPPRGPGYAERVDIPDQMFGLRAACDAGDRRACVQFGIIIGENRERRAQWRSERPELFWWER
jgi:hypothetical protein